MVLVFAEETPHANSQDGLATLPPRSDAARRFP